MRLSKSTTITNNNYSLLCLVAVAYWNPFGIHNFLKIIPILTLNQQRSTNFEIPSVYQQLDFASIYVLYINKRTRLKADLKKNFLIGACVFAQNYQILCLI